MRSKKLIKLLAILLIITPVYSICLVQIASASQKMRAGEGFQVCPTEIDTTNDKLAWEDIYRGTKYLFYKTVVEKKPVKFYAVSIDLTQPGVEITISPPQDRFIKTSEFAQKIGAQIAINGGFWILNTHNPLGLYVFEGGKYKGSEDDNNYGFFAVTKEGRPWISPPEEIFVFSPKKAYMAISGYPMIVRTGKVRNNRGIGYVSLKQPRSAVGIDKYGKNLFLVVSDGRQKDSAGIGLEVLAEFLVKIGVWDGLNLDGGGSSILYIEKKGGIVNKPSDGKERSVFNSLGVVIK